MQALLGLPVRIPSNSRIHYIFFARRTYHCIHSFVAGVDIHSDVAGDTCGESEDMSEQSESADSEEDEKAPVADAVREDEEMPHEFMCPITCDYMRDPVIAMVCSMRMFWLWIL